MSMQKSTRITLEQILYAAAFLLALALRLLRLAQSPLTDPEAELALQALGLVRGDLSGTLSGQPGYLLPAAALFALFGAGDGVARLIPALAGAGLVLLPALFRKELGSRAALIAAIGLALDPGLSALSRQASAFSWAVGFGLLCFAGLNNKKRLLAGISFGLAVLGGGHFWQGLLGAGLGYGFFRLIAGKASRLSGEEFEPQPAPKDFWRNAALAAAASLILGGSLFFIVPRGISAAGSSLVEFINGWLGRAGGGSFRLLLISLAVYETFGLVFALLQVIRAGFSRERKTVDLALIAWLLAALLIGLLNPSRSEAYLGWALIPMWALAARWLGDVILAKPLEQRLLAAVHAIALFALAVFAWLSMLGLLDPGKPPDEVQVRTFAAIGALLLAGASILLVAWGWSKKVAVYGVLWAAAALLVLWNISALFNAAGLGRNPEAQLWRSGPALLEEDLLLGSVGDLSEWNTGFRNAIDLAVIQIPSPALRWSLRDFNAVNFSDVTPPGGSPSLALTPDQPSPGLAATYRGQDFQWTSAPAWASFQPLDWLRWAAYKSAPMESEKLILWVRADRFPGAAPEQD